MSVGTYLRCDRATCRQEVLLESGHQGYLPQGWLQTFDARDAFGEPENLHFCSGNCAWMHEFQVEQARARVEDDAAPEAVAS